MHRLYRAAVLTCALTTALLLPAAAFAAGYYPVGSWPTVKTPTEPHDAVIAPDGEVFVADATGRRIVVYSSGGSYVREFDGRSGPGTELVRPVAVALGPDARLYVADRGGDRILVFERTGQLVRWWGTRGSAAGQFMSPSDVGIDGAGLVYVADTFNSRVQVFNATGTWQRTIGSGLISTPAAVAIKGSELFIAETNTLRVTVTSLAGTWVREWGWSTSGSGPGSTTTSRYLRPSGVEVDAASGNILVIDAGRGLIENCTSTNGFVNATYGTGFLAQPEGLFSGAGGVLTVADTVNHRLARFTTAVPGTVSTFVPVSADLPQQSLPRGVDVAPDGTTIVVESATGRVRRYDAAGGLLATFATSPSLSSPTGVVASRDGSEVYVCDTGNSRVVVYSAAGAYLRALGSPGVGPGQFSSPSAITENVDGTLVVADTGNNRLQVLYPDGTHLYDVGVGRLRAPAGVATGIDGRIYAADTGNHRILVFIGDGTYVRSLGSFGTSPGQLHTPAGLAMNAAGDRLLVTERGNHRAQLLTLTGTPVTVFGARGSGPGELNDPYAADFTSATGIVVADSGNHRVGRGEWDDVAPTTTPGGPIDVWSNAPAGATFTLGASDAGAGVTATYYRIGTGPAVSYTGPVTVNVEGETTVAYWSVDQVGNVEAERAFAVKLDRIAPTGSVVFGTAAATMRSGVIPVESYVGGATEMRLGRSGSMGSWVPFAQSSSIVVNVEGPTTLVGEYRDAAGNILTRTFSCTLDGTGPATTIFRTPPDAVSHSAVTVDLSASDALSPVARTRYRVDGGPERTYTGPFTVSGDGAHSVEAYAVDTVENVGATVRTDFGISRLTAGGDLSVAGGLAHIGYRTVEVSTTIQSAIRMRWDAGSGFSPWVPFLPTWYVTFPGDGFHTLKVEFEDSIGQRVVLTKPVHIDLTAPVTTASGAPPSGISAVPVMIGLDTVDDSPATITYRIDGGSPRTYAVPFTVTGDGNRTVTFSAVDAAGNVETEKSVTFVIAETPPDGSIRPAGGVVRLATRTVDLEVASPLAVKMRFDTGSGPQAWMPFASTARVTMPGEGLQWITATFANVAGVESQAAAQVLVDLTPPTVALGGTPIGVAPGAVNLWIVASDALSRVSSISYRVDDGAVQSYRGAFAVSGDGVHTVEYWAADEVGNTGSREVETFVISSLARGGSLTVAGGASRVGTLTVPVTANVSGASEMRVDSGSGFSSWRAFASRFDVTFPREGSGLVRLQARNELGVSTELTGTVFVDLTAPVTSVGGLPPGGASAGPVILVLSVSDVSPVSLTEYAVDGGAWRTYTGAFMVSGNGVHTVVYRSRDEVGNQESERRASFVIAGDRPEGGLKPAGGRSIVNTTTVSIEASVAGAVQMRYDTGSGFGPWTSYARTSSVRMPGPGLHWVVGAFRNVAGVESTLGVPVLVDTAPPVVTKVGAALRSFTVGSDRVPRYSLAVVGSAEDSGSPASGLGAWQWRLGSRSSSSGTFTGTKAGRYTSVATASDKAGNRGSRQGSVRLGAAAAPRVPSAVRANGAFSVRGTAPWAGSGAVGRIYAYKRAANGSWVLAKTITPSTKVAGSSATLSGRVALSRGQWRLVFVTSRAGAFVAGAPTAVITVK